MSQPEWITLEAASDMWDASVVGVGKAPDPNVMNAEFTEALAACCFSARGIRHDGYCDPAVTRSDVIDSHYFSRDIRAFRFGRIEAVSDAQSLDRFLVNRQRRANQPDYLDVLFEGARFRQWLADKYSASPTKDAAPQSSALKPLTVNSPEAIKFKERVQKNVERRSRRIWIDLAKEHFGDRPGVPSTAAAIDEQDRNEFPNSRILPGKPLKTKPVAD